MRIISKKEKKKRGCMYCLDYKKRRCIHEKCPYHELDKYKTYNEYFKEQEKKNKLLDILLDS